MEPPFEIAVAVPCPLPQTFAYKSPRQLEIGTRVRVPFGARQLVGVVWHPNNAETKNFAIKPIAEILDPEPIYSSTMLKLADWIASYYFHPIGEVLKTMLPLGTAKKAPKTVWQLLAPDQAEISGFFGKKTELSETTLVDKLKKAAITPSSFLAKMAKAGYIRKQVIKPDALVRATTAQVAPKGPLILGETPPLLRIWQSDALESILASSKPTLLHGITGSGKTEVFLQCIERIAQSEPLAQFLILVPEISLTPQMTANFSRRFPGLLAVVHSAQNPAHRWAELERIRSGEARILIGPRSAVFAPFACLKLIVVDEEHDASYKQTSGLTYNGRDVAIVRAQLEGAKVVLASATPSLESYQNALQARYTLAQMNQRASGAVLPTFAKIYSPGLNLSAEGISENSPAAQTIDSNIIDALKEQLAKGQQSLVLVNRRGWAFYLYDYEKKEAISCPNCSICLTLHRATKNLLCHYCEYRKPLKEFLALNSDRKFLAIGSGSQKVEAELKRLLPSARILRVDSDLAKTKDYLADNLAAFSRGEIDILVGTQMLAKGHDFANLTLTVLLDLDQMLCFPDFRAGERTFSLMVQAAGRAGRSELAGRVLVSGRLLDHPVLKKALAQDYLGFAEYELALRAKLSYPPFAKVILLIFTSEDERALDVFCAEVEKLLAFTLNQMEIKPKALGPTTSALAKINKRHRKLLVLVGKDLKPVRALADTIYRRTQKNPWKVQVQIDVDPLSIV